MSCNFLCGRMRTRTSLLFIAIALAIAAGAWFLFFGKAGENPAAPSSSVPIDPRIAYSGPYRNVHPRVNYIGDESCAECHVEIAATHRHSAMGRSLLPIAEVADLEDYSPETRNPFEAMGSQFRVERDGKRVWHKETRLGADGKPIYESAIEVHYVIGSGNNGRSYLTERDGWLFQTPLSWYSQKRIWDISPGFDEALHSGRPVGATCLFCHANRVEPIPGSINAYQKPIFRGNSIGCERCHGPGEEHARFRSSGQAIEGIDYSIVNPKDLEPRLRDSVCQQCHLEGEARVVKLGRDLFDFRPGLPLEEFWAVLVRAHDGEDRKAVNHVEQMELSACFQKSDGKLGCISCHDAHEKLPPDQRASHYRTSCLKCHDCPTPLPNRTTANANNCIACHMPRFSSSDIVHTASTDHRIVRRPAMDDPRAENVIAKRPPIFFPRRPPNKDSAMDSRDYAIGLMKMANKSGLPPGVLSRQILGHAERADKFASFDLNLLEAKASALQVLGRSADALETWQSILTQSPNNERALSNCATIAQFLGKRDLARSMMEKTIAQSPARHEYREMFAAHLIERRDWPEAANQCRALLKIDPASISARKMLIESLLGQGHEQEADAMFRVIELMRPPRFDELRRWFAVRKAQLLPEAKP